MHLSLVTTQHSLPLTICGGSRPTPSSLSYTRMGRACLRRDISLTGTSVGHLDVKAVLVVTTQTWGLPDASDSMLAGPRHNGVCVEERQRHDRRLGRLRQRSGSGRYFPPRPLGGALCTLFLFPVRTNAIIDKLSLIKNTVLLETQRIHWIKSSVAVGERAKERRCDGVSLTTAGDRLKYEHEWGVSVAGGGACWSPDQSKLPS